MSTKVSDEEIIKRAKRGYLKTHYQQVRMWELLNEVVAISSVLAVGSSLHSMSARVEELKDLMGHKRVNTSP